jgi:hypothetical protein
VRLEHAVPLRPALDQLGALGGPPSAKLGVQCLLAWRTLPTLTRRALAVRCTDCTLSNGQTQPAPAFHLEV